MVNGIPLGAGRVEWRGRDGGEGISEKVGVRVSINARRKEERGDA
jgi:hypothetical protein